MKTKVKYIAPWLAAAAIGGAVALAPVASAHTGSMPVLQTKIAAASPAPAQAPFVSDEDPLVPNNAGADPDTSKGPDPSTADQGTLGYINSNHDETSTAGGEQDLPS